MSVLWALLSDWLGAAWPGLAVAFLALLGWLGLRRRATPRPAPPPPIDPKLRAEAEAEVRAELARAQAAAKAKAQAALASPPTTAQEAIDDLTAALHNFDENDAP